jgi:chromate reductase, NAD(P)H dehydrogenase (quinone)
MRRPRVLLISGSTRAGSWNTFALESLRSAAQRTGLVIDLYDGVRALPTFVADAPALPAVVENLLSRIARADSVVFATPEYAGGLPGALKNLLDWTVGGGQLYDKPVAWLDVAHPHRGAGARNQLRTVLGYVGARVVEPACVHVNLDRNGTAVRLGHGAEERLKAALAALTSALDQGETNHDLAC